MAVSELTWISSSRPKEIENFWIQEYPEIDIASNKIKLLEENGYTLIGYFYLNQDSWIENYYKPIEKRFVTFLNQNNHTKLAKKVVEEYKTEIDFYLRFKEYFNYGFYIAKKD